MRNWIFQANPDRFDIDGFLATRPVTFTWLVSRFADEIQVGDRVFLWQAASKGDEKKCGIVTEARVTGPVVPQPSDPGSIPFWRNGADGDEVVDRVTLTLVRVANNHERLRRRWLKDDPILRDLSIIKMAAATNFRVTDHQVDRLLALWMKTGRDWSYAEALAGLYAYQATLGGEISKLEGSVVANIALRIGRAVTGVYNKVLNFRAIDPRDPRAGMAAGSKVDRRVWDEFFDAEAGQLRREELEAAFRRLWPDNDGHLPTDSAVVAEQNVSDQADKLSRLGLDALLRRYGRRAVQGQQGPSCQVVLTRSFDRDPMVVAIAKSRAGDRCEVPGCQNHVFIGANGMPHSEVHHILPLAQGGADTIDNVVCLCPGHHREAHHGVRAGALAEIFRHIRAGHGENVEG